MSKYRVIVALDDGTAADAVLGALTAVLRRYDWNREVPRHVHRTRQQVIDEGRAANANSREWPDVQVYEHQLAFWGFDDIGRAGEVYTTLNPEGEWDDWVIDDPLHSTSPLAPSIDDSPAYRAWSLRSTRCTTTDQPETWSDLSRLRHIDRSTIQTPYAYIDRAGSWHDKARAAEPWAAWFQSAVAELPEATWLAAVVCHI